MNNSPEFAEEAIAGSSQTDDMEHLWEQAKAVEMSDEALSEQRIHHVFANANLSDPRITIDTVRAAHTLVQSAEADTA